MRAYQSSRLKKAKDRGEVADYDQGAVTDDDNIIMQKLLAKRVFTASGADFGSEEIARFRIAFAHPRSYMEEGLRRMIDALS